VNGRVRMVVFLAGAMGLAALLSLAFARMAPFGGTTHLYRDLAVPAAVAHRTANVVSSVNFDQRGLDTFGEESILLASVIGAAVLLRPAREETRRLPPPAGRVLESTRMAGYLMLPVSLLVGFNVVAHGQVTPGGGFQGGVILATGWHLLYVAGNYRSLDRLRPLAAFDTGDALGALAFGGLGLAGLAVAGAFLANFLPLGTFGQILSGGLVPVLNVAVGLEVACAVVVLLAHFLAQHIVVHTRRG
jgi:multicomponent Na+:H+ antiporter subunit B